MSNLPAKVGIIGCGAISAKYLENAEKFDNETANYIRDIWDQV